MFDNLLLIARGKIIFFNKAARAVDYFASIGYACPETSNPCDYFMSMMSIESLELEDEEVDVLSKNKIVPKKKSIQEEYLELIEFFDMKYLESDLVNRADEVHPEVRPLSNSDTSV